MCPTGETPYKATQVCMVGGQVRHADEVFCQPATAEVSTLVMLGALLVQAEDGTFPVPVVAPSYCCGNPGPLTGI